MQTTYKQPGAPTTDPQVWIDDGGPDQDTPRHALTRAGSWPAGKLADIELRWTAGTLEGMKLAGFALWEARTGRNPDGSPRLNVTMPARVYSVNGERRSFALLRPILDTSSQEHLRDVILDAYKEHEAALAEAV